MRIHRITSSLNHVNTLQSLWDGYADYWKRKDAVPASPSLAHPPFAESVPRLKPNPRQGADWIYALPRAAALGGSSKMVLGRPGRRQIEDTPQAIHAVAPHEPKCAPRGGFVGAIPFKPAQPAREGPGRSGPSPEARDPRGSKETTSQLDTSQGEAVRKTACRRQALRERAAFSLSLARHGRALRYDI
jgi:hypothetical protein